MSDNKTGSSNVFAGRNFRLVFFGALVSELGSILYSFAVSFYILEISGNNAVLQGLYLALCGAVMLICTPIGGVLGDRFNKAKIMYMCDYIKGGLIIIATAAMLALRSNSAHLAVLFVIGIVGNTVSGIFNPASTALLPHIVEDDKLQQANAYFTIKSSLESILGIILAGILYASLSIYTLFFFVGTCYVASGVSEMFIRYDHRPSAEKLTLKLALSDMRGGLVYLKDQKALVAILASALFINFFMTPVTSNFMPFFIKTKVAGADSYLFDRLLTPELWSSVFSVMFGISSLAGAAVLSARPQAEKCGRRVALWICAAAVMMILLTGSYWFFAERTSMLNVFLLAFCAWCLLMGLVIVCVNIPLNTVMMRVVDKDKLSKVSGITSVFAQALIPIASLLAGIALQLSGCTMLLSVCTVGFTAAALALLFSKEAKKI